MGFLKTLAENPLTKGLDLDHPGTTEIRKTILNNKIFLRNVYIQWYKLIREHIPQIDGRVLELGTGAGFLQEFVKDLITSDMMPVKNCHLACDGVHLPFQDNCLRSLVMLNVLHHIADPDSFFVESSRCIKEQGTMIMIEPWLTPWSHFIYANFHHEPFDPFAKLWKLPPSGPLSGGNDALPWIIFNRDLKDFRHKHAYWSVEKILPGFPLSYLLSGGMSMRQFLPDFLFAPVELFERYLPDWVMKKIAMFVLIVLKNK